MCVRMNVKNVKMYKCNVLLVLEMLSGRNSVYNY